MGTNNGFSVLEVVNTYIESTGAKINFEFDKRRQGDAEKCVPNSSKIANDLGWKPTTSLREMCIDSYNFIMKNPEGI
jgi:UDP-glucose 4-epimerase